MDRESFRSALARVRRGNLRRVLPVALVLLSLGVAGAGAWEAYRAERSHRETAEGVLRGYGVFAARSFAAAWTPEIQAALGATLRDARSAAVRKTTTRQCLDALLLADRREDASCGCARSLVGEDAWAFQMFLSDRGSELFWAGATPGGDVRDRALSAILATARAEMGRSDYMLRWVDTGEEAPRLFAFAAVLTFSERGGTARDTAVYGVQVDPERLRETLAHAIENHDIVPPALAGDRSTSELMAVTLHRPDGATAFASAPGTSMALHGEQAVPDALGGGVIRAAILPEAAGALVIGGLPKSRMPLLLLVLALAGGLALLAVTQFRKEEAFAQQRQDFVAGVSHELRTPLAQIRLFVETLRLGRTRNEAERAWALGNIDRETLRLTRLVENILLFSRAERGALAAGLDLHPADLAEEARSVVASFEPLLGSRQARLEVDVPDRLVAEVHLDSIRQVLLNLLDNAVKYGPRGQTVRVVGRREGSAVRLAVEDQGPGVRPEERDAVFEPFRRGDDAVGSVATGSGIGLALVREIVRLHGGDVRVEDADGGGARFVVDLPALDTASPGRIPGAGAAGEAGARPSAVPPADVA